jgi:hypothetical protein
MSTRSPHKNFSLSKLERIKQENYYDETTKKDYNAYEVDQMIFDKQTKQSEKSQKEYLRGLTSMEFESDKLLKIKLCTSCKWKLPYGYFSPDKSKKSSLRSHCKDCRNKKGSTVMDRAYSR